MKLMNQKGRQGVEPYFDSDGRQGVPLLELTGKIFGDSLLIIQIPEYNSYPKYHRITMI